MAKLHVFEFLTHDELRIAMCVVMATKAEESRGVYPIDRYATPGEEGATQDWTELVLRAVRYLAFEHGMKFQGIVPHRDGRVTAEKPICEANGLYVALFQGGGFPDFDILIPQALRWAELNLPTLDREPLRAVHAEIEAAIAARMKVVDPDAMAEIVKLRKRAMGEAYEDLARPVPRSEIPN